MCSMIYVKSLVSQLQPSELQLNATLFSTRCDETTQKLYKAGYRILNIIRGAQKCISIFCGCTKLFVFQIDLI